MKLLELPKELIAGETFNAGHQNHSVSDIATMVREVVEKEIPKLAPIQIKAVPTNDIRSYHVSSKKIANRLNFRPKRSVEDAVLDLCGAFTSGKLPESLSDDQYINVSTVKRLGLS